MHSPIFSLEVFPPKRTSPVGTIYDTLDGLQGLDPDFISVTYGTGKSSDRTLTARIAHTVNEYGIPAVAHLTAQYLDKDDVDEALDLFDQAKVSGVLALRGDRVEGAEPAGVFDHASDLAAYIREKRPDLKIYGACYPEKHPQAKSVLRMSKMCESRVPEKLAVLLDKWGSDTALLKEAGIAYASEQICDLAARGVDGVHLYTMNHPCVSRRIWSNVKPFFV